MKLSKEEADLVHLVLLVIKHDGNPKTVLNRLGGWRTVDSLLAKLTHITHDDEEVTSAIGKLHAELTGQAGNR